MSEDRTLLPGLEMPMSKGPQPSAAPAARAARVKPVDRAQSCFKLIDIEQLIEPEHPARVLWELVGRLDLSGFYQIIQAVEGAAGRPAWDPQLLISVWVYGYSRGISSARELARRCEYEPAFQWLAGLEKINYHTLADFRSSYDQLLRELFVQVLGVLSAQGLVTLERVMQDGTKIKALAAKSSFCQEPSLQEHLAAARQQVESLADWQAEETPRQKAAQQRAARERQSRVEQAFQELEQIRQQQPKTPAQEVRVSHTDPQGRVMKQADGGYAPSYNVQLSTDAAHKIIVAAAVSQNGSDYTQLLPALQRIEQNCQAKPNQVVADGGFTSRTNIEGMAAAGIEFIGSLSEPTPDRNGQLARRGTTPAFYPEAFTYDASSDTYRCPLGTILTSIGCKQRKGALEHTYRADRRACQACPFQEQCCGRQASKPRLVIRLEESAEVKAFRQHMQSEQAKQIYRQRSEVAEFPNAWIKQKFGLRQFRLRGLHKVGLEVLWACLTYNFQQWIRLLGQAKAALAS